MALSVKMEFRQSQSLVMTPQLQQAIKLLQLSNLELGEFVDAELERNPLLERGESQSPEQAPQDDRPGDGSSQAIDKKESALSSDSKNASDSPEEAADS